MDVTLALSHDEAILVVHALLAANIHSEQTAAILGDDNTEQDMARADVAFNITRRSAIVDRLDAALGRKAA